MENNSVDAVRQALLDIEQTRAQVARGLITPWWYHPILGLLAGSFLVAMVLGDTWVMIPAILMYSLGLGILVAAYKSRTGLWVSGLRAGRAAKWSYLLVACLLACTGIALGSHLGLGIAWPTWVAAVVVLLSVILIGRRFDAALRAELREAV